LGPYWFVLTTLLNFYHHWKGSENLIKDEPQQVPILLFWKTMNQNCGFQVLAVTQCLIDNFVSLFIWKTMHQNWPLALLDRQLCFSFIWRRMHQNCGFQIVANHTMLNRQVHSSFCREKRKSGFQIFSLTLSRIIVTLSRILPLVL
jgi:hypothetical protein